MKIKDLDFFKIPEGLKVPFLSGFLYSFITKQQRKIIASLPIDGLELNKKPREEKIILSLTSFPARIHVVGYTLKSLFNQTIKPDKIILWLAEEQFQNVELPILLQDLGRKGLEIRYCKDLRSHKKYFFALQEQKKDELIITYDDDLIYPENSIELLYKKHLQYPDCIVCNRAQECLATEENTLEPYNKWKVYSNEGINSPSTKLFPSTGGGTLYPFGAVDKEAFNEIALKELKKIAKK